MSKHTPRVEANMQCPIHLEARRVELAVNVFRDADHQGLDVASCSEFHDQAGSVSCGKDCVHSAEGHRLHEAEVAKHRADLMTIGSNVIG